jgi:hypothetical protein
VAHCTSKVYEQLQTPGEQAAIMSACTSLIEAADTAADLKARALYFRGLNLFLAETMKKISEPAAAAFELRGTIGFDLDKSAFEKTLEEFGTRAAAAEWAFVYYAGHGLEIEDKNYLVPVDADLTTLRDAGAHGVPLQTIVDRVKPAHALRIAMLDACRDNPFVQAAHRAQAESRSIELGADELAAFHAIGGGLAPVNV